jgi:hypothetical protein
MCNDVCNDNVCGCPCDINGTCYPAGARNPANECEVCEPGTSTTSWTPQSGVSCTDDGFSCTADMCNAGSCEHTIDSNSCLIDDVCYDTGDPESTQLDCNVCDPNTDQESFTQQTNTCVIGGTCYNSGESQAGNFCQVCEPSTSTTTFSLASGTCFINGNCFNSGVSKSGEFCQVCDPTTSTSSFTRDPMTCYIGNTCYNNGEQQSASKSCRECDPNSNSFVTNPNNCYINDTCYNDGDTLAATGDDGCKLCDPSQSQNGFVNNDTASASVACDDSLDCTTDSCSSEACVNARDTNKCLINGTCYDDGEAAGPMGDDACKLCDPNQNSFVNNTAADVPACDDSLTCTDNVCAGQVCHNPLQDKKCLINGNCYNDGEAAGTMGDDACQLCDSSTNNFVNNDAASVAGCDDSATCTTNFCTNQACDTSIDTGCFINGMCVGEGTEQSGGCEVCDSATDDDAWTLPNLGTVCDFSGTDDGFCDGSGTCIEYAATEDAATRVTSAPVCGDGVDNDGDSSVDCDDSDCLNEQCDENDPNRTCNSGNNCVP